MMSFAPIVSFILNSGGAWREATTQCLVSWRESAVLRPTVIEKRVVNTIDRWLDWSAANVPGIACMLACFNHFTLSSLFDDHPALPKPMKMYFIHQHLDASVGLRPRERVRLGSCGLIALLLRRSCQQLPSHQRSSHLFAVKLGKWAIGRVCSCICCISVE